MNIGISTFPTDYSTDIALLARWAEEMGFESLWVPEHPIIPVQTSSPWPGSADGAIPKAYADIVDPFVALGRASAVTSTIKLGTGICLVPERNPLLLAKEVATLDMYSSGRFLFGIGAGWLKEETEIMGGDFPHRWTQTREAILANEVAVDRGRKRVSRQILRLPARLFVPQVCSAASSSSVPGWHGSQRVQTSRGLGRRLDAQQSDSG